MFATLTSALLAAGGPWDRIGPWNIFDDKRSPPQGEAGTLACAASPRDKPNIIYAGGQNNGVSSGIIKTVNGGVNWTRQSKGLWDTRISGVWVHRDDDDHIFAGSHSGVYESTDAAASWTLKAETASWGTVMSFRAGMIQGEKYVLANSQNGILTRPWKGGTWQRIETPGMQGIASNQHLSVAVHDGTTEVLTSIGGWGGGTLWYLSVDSPSDGTWTGPITTQNKTYDSWGFFPGTSQMYGKCTAPTTCDADVHPLGVFNDLAGCQAAVNATSAFEVAAYTYQHKGVGGGYDGQCYAMSSFVWSPTTQPNVDSGRAPGSFPGVAVDCANAAVDPQDRDHFLYSKAGEYRAWESRDGGGTTHELTAHPTASYFVMIDPKNASWYYTATQARARSSGWWCDPSSGWCDHAPLGGDDPLLWVVTRASSGWCDPSSGRCGPLSQWCLPLQPPPFAGGRVREQQLGRQLVGLPRHRLRAHRQPHHRPRPARLPADRARPARRPDRLPLRPGGCTPTSHPPSGYRLTPQPL